MKKNYFMCLYAGRYLYTSVVAERDKIIERMWERWEKNEWQRWGGWTINQWKWMRKKEKERRVK